jgi:transposase
MEPLYHCCAGLDVHKDSVVACVRRLDAGGRARKEVRSFGTMTVALLQLLDWLLAEGVTHAAMESTGVYWKPIFNLLEGPLHIILVNAQHLKKVPGRKTDVQDAEWIAELLQHGLLKASFVPPTPIRELRDLTRQRTQLIAEKASAANRIQKVLEDANIKLASVATDVLGESGRDMIRALIAGQTDVEQMADLARKRLRAKIPALQRALEGRVTDHHRFLLQLHLDHIEELERMIGRLSQRIEDQLAPFAETLERLQTIPGISQRTAETLAAEIGLDMAPFPTADHLASWAGICPGHDQSAGKRRSGRTRAGNRWLKQILVQAGWAASRTKDTYLRAQYHRLARRRGKKRAVIAVGHSLLRIVYYVLKRGTTYQELGADHWEQRQSERLTRQLVRRLESLGHKVTLEEGDAA